MRRFRFSSRMYNLFRCVDARGERFQAWCAGLRGRSVVLSVLVGVSLGAGCVAVVGGLLVALVVMVLVGIAVLVVGIAMMAVFLMVSVVLAGLVLALSYLALPLMCLLSGSEAGCGGRYNGGVVG